MQQDASSAPQRPTTPLLTVDIVIRMPMGGIVLIERAREPLGWALPGGFVDVGESCERAACREALEETGLVVQLLRQIGTYSDPARDPRGATASAVYEAISLSDGEPTGGDDAAAARVFAVAELPWSELAFDHARIVRDYLAGQGPAVSVACPALPALGPDDARALLDHTRAALTAFARRGELHQAPPARARLRARQAIFVSLVDARGRERGCSGYLQTPLELGDAAAELALVAASQLADGNDAAGLSVRIDILQPLPGALDPDRVDPATNAIVVECAGRRAVLLPRFGDTEIWTAVEFWGAACAKAGLPTDAWRSADARLSAYDAATLWESR